MTMWRAVQIALLVVFAVAAMQPCFASLQFINDGIIKSNTQITSFIKSKESALASSEVPCVNFIDCTVVGNGQQICNQLVATSFEPCRNGK
jgi:hypothetical protein